MAYHTGPGVKKSGPKGNRNAKGVVLQAIHDEIEREPAQSSFSISDRVKKKTGVRISASRIRAIRHAWGKSRLKRRSIPLVASTPALR